ncbi:protein VACUOLELESS GAMETOPHYTES-like [Mercurialis annua]|uniref:protein VACUOLELESS GAMETOPHYTES-like n=1 Tax=Mercurialis annua TaxID=3986 RepID=UPI00216105DA|nr:protein VACUOLELESS GAMETOPHYTES-like [Mercurialis annua]
MGRLHLDDHNHDHDLILQHFSHPHTLKLLNFNSQIIPNELVITCAACKLLAYGWMYSCTSSCSYFLHKTCSKMPPTKNHPIDPHHTLTLLPFPVYSQGSFKCNACGDHGTGFCYHCKDCKIDLHILCAHMPSSVKSSNSHNHVLNLCFSPPYHKKAFRCDICNRSGSNHWLYRCESCSFDAHLNCAIADTQTNSKQQQQQQNQVADAPIYQEQQNQAANPMIQQKQQNQVGNPTVYRFASSAMVSPSPPLQQQQFWRPNVIPTVGSSSWFEHPVDQMAGYRSGGMAGPISPYNGFVEAPRNNRFTENNMTGMVIKGVLEGVSQQAGQILLASIFGGFSFT